MVDAVRVIFLFPFLEISRALVDRRQEMLVSVALFDLKTIFHLGGLLFGL